MEKLTKEVWAMADPVMQGPGAPTKAEVNATINILRGEPICDDTLEALLLTTNRDNRELVEQNVKLWNETAAGEINQRIQQMALGNLAGAICLRGHSGLADTSELLRINLTMAVQAELS